MIEAPTAAKIQTAAEPGLKYHRTAPRLLLRSRHNFWEEEHLPVRIDTLTATVAAAALLLATASLVSRAETTLDYDYFKAKVQPIFLTKRATHARCVMCHAGANNMLHLEPLPEGQTVWTEEQTRKNFETVSKIVQAVDDPLQSKILVHPLAPEGGGDVWHSGGRQFANRNDPSWKTIYAWAKGAKLSDGKK